MAPAQPAFRRWIGVVGLFIAPTTVSTSLCYYFGYVYARKYFDYFGMIPTHSDSRPVIT